MTIFERLWNTVSEFLGHLIGDSAPAIVSWAKQFATDEGKIIFADALAYAPKILAHEITIVEASNLLWTDLKAKGIDDVKLLGEVVYNALRTHINDVVVNKVETPPAA